MLVPPSSVSTSNAILLLKTTSFIVKVKQLRFLCDVSIQRWFSIEIETETVEDIEKGQNILIYF